MAEFVVRLITEIIFELVTYHTGRVVLMALSLGSVRAEPFGARPGDHNGPRPQGTRVVGSHIAVLTGVVFWLAVFVSAILIWRWFFVGCPSGIVAPDGACIY